MAVASASAMGQGSYHLQESYMSGAAIYVNPYGGDYFYLPMVNDGRPLTPPMLVSRPPREYEFFSAEEEEALTKLYDSEVSKRVKARLLAQRKAYLAKVSKYNWPKVVVEGNEICVPELASSESADWKSNLICYEQKPLQEAN